MLSLLATLVFAAAGCLSASVIGLAVRDALPALRRLRSERRGLADDRAYLFTLIDTPRHCSMSAITADGAMVACVADAALAPRAASPIVVRRQGRGSMVAAPLRAAA